MTRRGSAQRPWTTDDIAALRDMAGRLPRREICRELKRGKRAVESAALRLGLSLRCYVQRLSWCNECATWRSHLDKDGKCRVCALRERLAGREEACSKALAAMTPEQRAVYAGSEAKRSTRRFPPRPQKRMYCTVSRYQRDRAEADHLLAIEEWEYRRLKLPYDAAKTRLRRMREVTGTNPRKKSK